MSGKVALTFDDGPDPVWTQRVLDALGTAGARATFFVVAPRAEQNSELLDRTVEDGHEVAFHCTEHRRHDGLTVGEIRADARAGLDVLQRLGHEPKDWRVPWGLVTRATEEVAGELGLRLVGWTVDSEDWRGDPPEQMLARMERGLEDGAVVLMHDGLGPGATRDGCAETVALVEPLIARLRERSLEPVSLGGLGGPLPHRNPGGFSGV